MGHSAPRNTSRVDGWWSTTNALCITYQGRIDLCFSSGFAGEPGDWAHELALPAESRLAVDHCKLEANSVLSGFGELGNFLWPGTSGIVTRVTRNLCV